MSTIVVVVALAALLVAGAVIGALYDTREFDEPDQR